MRYKKEQEQLKVKELEDELIFVKTHGMSSIEFKKREEEKRLKEEEEKEKQFVAEHGMSRNEYQRKKWEKENEERDRVEKEEARAKLLKMKEELLQNLKEDPMYQVKEVDKLFQDSIETDFEEYLKDWEEEMFLQVNVKERTFITLDGKKYKVGIFEVPN